jgi:hypothetical protein
MTINLTVNDKEYKKLEDISKSSGKPIESLLSDMIRLYSNRKKKQTVPQDPFYTIDGFDGKGPTDASINHDAYIYKL